MTELEQLRKEVNELRERVAKLEGGAVMRYDGKTVGDLITMGSGIHAGAVYVTSRPKLPEPSPADVWMGKKEGAV